MCNDEVIDALRQQMRSFISHAGVLRSRYSEVEEEFREGNLDAEGLRLLNRAVHEVETDAAAFEKLLES
jgi:hypothetical protein